MAKLYIGFNYIDFIYSGSGYSGILSKIVLNDKTIYRVDYTSVKSQVSGRYEVNYIKDETGQVQWIPVSGTDAELATILNSEIEKKHDLLQPD